MAPRKIQDQYTKKRVKRQYRYSLRQRDRGKCAECGNLLSNRSTWYCEKHLEIIRKRVKEYNTQNTNKPHNPKNGVGI